MRVLLIQHAKWENAGIIGAYLRKSRQANEVVRLYRNEAIPFKRLERRAYSAVVSLGSPSTAYKPETNSHHYEEMELFKLVRDLDIPSFSICYSMQLFCLAHGGSVVANPKGKEVGFFDVRLTREGREDPILGEVGDYRTLQWHGDCVSKLPRGAVHLAYSDKTEYQVAVLDGIHYLFQGDGQAATPSMLESWFAQDGAWATQGSGVVRESVLREATEKRRYYHRLYTQIFRNFIGLAERHSADSR